MLVSPLWRRQREHSTKANQRHWCAATGSPPALCVTSPTQLTRARTHADWMETLTLLDGSLQGQGTVDITVFGTDAENLPRVRQVGDIVRLHRVKVRCD